MLSTRHYRKNFGEGDLENLFSQTGGALTQVLSPVMTATGQIVQGVVNAAGQILDGTGKIIGLTADGARHLADEVTRPVVNAVSSAISSMQSFVTQTGPVINTQVFSEFLQQTNRDIANLHVQLNPARHITDFLSENPLTAHAYSELDKFTGGMITSDVNVSDLVYRAQRGDAISKQELARDAIFLLQVLAIGTGGGAVIGAMVGNMVGNEACKTIQNNDQKEACKIAFAVVGAAAGGALATSGSFSDNLSRSGQNLLKSKVTQAATKVAIVACQANQWAGAQECAVLGKIGSDYLKRVASGEDLDWLDFLGREAAEIGAAILIRDAFPAGSPEREALERRLRDPFIAPQLPARTRPAGSLDAGSVEWGSSLIPWLVGAGLIAAAVG